MDTYASMKLIWKEGKQINSKLTIQLFDRLHNIEKLINIFLFAKSEGKWEQDRIYMYMQNLPIYILV